MKFSNPKTLPRQSNIKNPSQNDLPLPLPLKSDSNKPKKSTSVLVLKKPLQPNQKPAFLKKAKVSEKKEEVKVEMEPKKTGLFTMLPSKKYTSIKTIDPFADTSKTKMFFSS